MLVSALIVRVNGMPLMPLGFCSSPGPSHLDRIWEIMIIQAANTGVPDFASTHLWIEIWFMTLYTLPSSPWLSTVPKASCTTDRAPASARWSRIVGDKRSALDVDRRYQVDDAATESKICRGCKGGNIKWCESLLWRSAKTERFKRYRQGSVISLRSFGGLFKGIEVGADGRVLCYDEGSWCRARDRMLLLRNADCMKVQSAGCACRRSRAWLKHRDQKEREPVAGSDTGVKRIR